VFSSLMFVAGCVCGAFMYAVYQCRPRQNTKVGTPSASHNRQSKPCQTTCCVDNYDRQCVHVKYPCRTHS
jgi:hypothetical protein